MMRPGRPSFNRNFLSCCSLLVAWSLFIEASSSDTLDSECPSFLQLRHHSNESVTAPTSWSSAITWATYPSKCIDVKDGKAVNGVRLQLWDCLANSLNQKFIWSDSDGKIRWAASPNLCIDVLNHGNYNGNVLQLWECSNVDQLWTITANGATVSLQWTSHPDKCIDIRDSLTTNGTPLQVWSCSVVSGAQQFSLSDESYDIIIVGAGLTGSVVASKLSERFPQRRLLLVEAGEASHASLGGSQPPAFWKNGQWNTITGLSQSGTRYDVPGNYGGLQCWDRKCSESWGAAVPVFQCKILGGCGVMNGALMQWPSDSNFDSWPLGWKASDINPYLRSVRSMFNVTQVPSSDGTHYLSGAGADFVKDGLQAAGYKDASGLKIAPNTMKVPHVTASNGKRESTASVMLPAALERQNFTLWLNSEVLQILQFTGQATGVRIKKQGVEMLASLASGGLLVLTAGALNTPRLLLNSGMTASGQVGATVTDHTIQGLRYALTSDMSISATTDSFFVESMKPSVVSQYAGGNAGPLAQYGPTLTAFLRDPSTPGSAQELDVEFFVGTNVGPREVSITLVLLRSTCSTAMLFRKADGSLGLNGSTLAPCARDQQTMKYALTMLDKYMLAKGLVRSNTGAFVNMNHWASSCALGSCVDPSTLLLRNRKNVAVADASILPTQIWAHPVMTLTAIALKAADMLAAQVPSSL